MNHQKRISFFCLSHKSRPLLISHLPIVELINNARDISILRRLTGSYPGVVWRFIIICLSTDKCHKNIFSRHNFREQAWQIYLHTDLADSDLLSTVWRSSLVQPWTVLYHFFYKRFNSKTCVLAKKPDAGGVLKPQFFFMVINAYFDFRQHNSFLISLN